MTKKVKLKLIAFFQAVIDALHKYKADLNKPLSISKARATPLMLAAAQGHVQTCITLVEVFTAYFLAQTHLYYLQYTMYVP